jgi:hypothetical protein
VRALKIGLVPILNSRMSPIRTIQCVDRIARIRMCACEYPASERLMTSESCAEIGFVHSISPGFIMQNIEKRLDRPRPERVRLAQSIA